MTTKYKKPKWLLIASMLAVFAVFAASCGDDDDGASPATTTAAPTTSAAATTTTYDPAAAHDLDSRAGAGA